MKRQANACRLLTPGPVSIEASVLEAMTCCPSPADAAFISMMEDVRRRLLRVAGMRPAEYAAVLTAGLCAFALEATLTTLIPEESRVLVVCNGARAEAACRMLAREDIAFEKLETGFEQAADAAEIAMLLDERSDITHVAVVHVDAVSGLRNDLGEIGRAVRAAGRTFIVDADVSFGVASIDVLVSGADCGLKGVSGLSFVLASSRPKDEHTASRSTSSKACAGRKPESRTSCHLRPSPPCMPRWTLSTRWAASPCARRPP